MCFSPSFLNALADWPSVPVGQSARWKPSFAENRKRANEAARGVESLVEGAEKALLRRN